MSLKLNTWFKKRKRTEGYKKVRIQKLKTKGGYQVSEKWLKDRKGRTLSSEEVSHYVRVITAIAETISIHGFLDDLFAEVETSLLEVRL